MEEDIFTSAFASLGAAADADSADADRAGADSSVDAADEVHSLIV